MASLQINAGIQYIIFATVKLIYLMNINYAKVYKHENVYEHWQKSAMLHVDYPVCCCC